MSISPGKVIETTADKIVDPFMWFALLIIAALLGLIYFILKYLLGKSMSDLFVALREQSRDIAEYNKSLYAVLESLRTVAAKGRRV